MQSISRQGAEGWWGKRHPFSFHGNAEKGKQ